MASCAGRSSRPAASTRSTRTPSSGGRSAEPARRARARCSSVRRRSHSSTATWPAVAKVLRDFARTNPNLVVKGGLIGTTCSTPGRHGARRPPVPRGAARADRRRLAAPLQQFAGLLAGAAAEPRLRRSRRSSKSAAASAPARAADGEPGPRSRRPSAATPAAGRSRRGGSRRRTPRRGGHAGGIAEAGAGPKRPTRRAPAPVAEVAATAGSRRQPSPEPAPAAAPTPRSSGARRGTSRGGGQLQPRRGDSRTAEAAAVASDR